MAYSPVEQGRLLAHPVLSDVADRRGAKPAAVALAWLLRRAGLFVIPKAGTREHVRDNAAAAGLALDARDLADLDRAFQAPSRKVPLAML